MSLGNIMLKEKKASHKESYIYDSIYMKYPE